MFFNMDSGETRSSTNSSNIWCWLVDGNFWFCKDKLEVFIKNFPVLDFCDLCEQVQIADSKSFFELDKNGIFIDFHEADLDNTYRNLTIGNNQIEFEIFEFQIKSISALSSFLKISSSNQ